MLGHNFIDDNGFLLWSQFILVFNYIFIIEFQWSLIDVLEHVVIDIVH